MLRQKETVSLTPTSCHSLLLVVDPTTSIGCVAVTLEASREKDVALITLHWQALQRGFHLQLQ
ncbi:hypothetical protein OXYTRIMIC_044 [Oxytricha trifallax]|uniref:Uncharacterized protein n=1 Tax=Oxytricha trifallax TaxID=1172189 RepID=A0A073IB19_9SPIT|nr:hypothetical protein OXYTRIMIC_044 [Oxytricha trifallax]